MRVYIITETRYNFWKLIITARVRSMGKGVMFLLCVSVHRGGGRSHSSRSGGGGGDRGSPSSWSGDPPSKSFEKKFGGAWAVHLLRSRRKIFLLRFKTVQRTLCHLAINTTMLVVLFNVVMYRTGRQTFKIPQLFGLKLACLTIPDSCSVICSSSKYSSCVPFYNS